MFKKKRILACILALAIAFAMVAACGPETSLDDMPPAATPKPADPVADPPPVDETDNRTPNERGLSRYDEPVTVRIARNVDETMVFAPGQSYENNIWMTEYYDVLGINVETAWEAIGYDSYNERMNLMIAANDLPDAFQVNGAQLVSLVNANRLTDMQSYVDNWATDFYRENLYADGGLSMEQSTFGGRLMALPRTGVAVGDWHMMVIRDDWRKELGLPEPQTFDDMVNMARAFKDADLDGANAYGFALGNDATETWFTVRGLFNSFGAFSKIWIEKDGGLVYGNVQPEMKTALAAMNEWFNEGLIDREFAAKGQWDGAFPDAMAGRSGIAVGMSWFLGWPLVPDGVSNGQEWKPYMIPFHPDAPQQKIAARAASDGGFVVRAGFENPEALIKMNNLWQDRIMSGQHDLDIYKGDDEYVYEFLAAFAPTNGPDRNRTANFLIKEALTTGNHNIPELVDNPEFMRWFESVRDFYNGEVIIQFKADDDADPMEYRAPAEEVWAHIRGESTLIVNDPNSDDIIAQMRGRFVNNYGDFFGRFGPNSVFELDLFMTNNNMFMMDKYIGPSTDGMQLYEGGLESDFIEIVINIITGTVPVDAFDQFVIDWHANGGDQITAEVNAWYDTVR